MSEIAASNLFDSLPAAARDEVFEVLARGADVLVERIVSHGQTTPDGTWLRGDKAEWVVLLRGRARLLFRSPEREVELRPGDAVTIPAGVEHRVTMTDPDAASVWLAVHFTSGASR